MTPSYCLYKKLPCGCVSRQKLSVRNRLKTFPREKSFPEVAAAFSSVEFFAVALPTNITRERFTHAYDNINRV